MAPGHALRCYLFIFSQKNEEDIRSNRWRCVHNINLLLDTTQCLYKQKKPRTFRSRLSLNKKGGDILSRCYPVPSALIGLTSLFGMGRGDPHRNSRPKSYVF